jgi:sialidase-1
MRTLFFSAGLLLFVATLGLQASGQTDRATTAELDQPTRDRCLSILDVALRGADFWPAMHAAEALSQAGKGALVRRYLTPKLGIEHDDQHRCGLARELVRAGDRQHARVMLDILAGENPHGHVHAAESLYKVFELGNGSELRAAFEQTENLTLRLMAAAALGRSGNGEAMKLLRTTVKNGNESVGRLAAWVLARIGDPSDIPMIRRRAESAGDSVDRCFHEHALARLGDRYGKQALLKNLRSREAAIRTYAAVFAGESRMVEAVDRIRELLDDENVDVRVRAAQALLVLDSPSRPPESGHTGIVFSATMKNPRYTEGSLVELNNGDLLLAVTEFVDGGSDFSRVRIVARRSSDRGRTWQDPVVLQETTGKLNVMSVTLRRLHAPHDRTIAFFYLQKNAVDDLRVFVRFSRDECRTFSEPILVTSQDGYHVMNNDRVTQLSTGRLLVPLASTSNVSTVNHFVSRCWISDDAGKSWRPGKGQVDLPKRGAMEPEIVELRDGRLLMITRTQLGYIAASYSEDGGDSWSNPRPLGNLQAPEAPATIRRIPSTGDLLLVWNNVFKDGAGHGGRRTPLTAAISTDDGQTWQHVRNLETDETRTFSYVSVLFSQGKAHLSYWDNIGRSYSTRHRAVPISWFYENTQ